MDEAEREAFLHNGNLLEGAMTIGSKDEAKDVPADLGT